MQSGVDALPSPLPPTRLPTSPRGTSRRCSPFWPNMLPGVFRQPLEVLQGAARRHPSTSRSYYRSTHPASTRRGRAPAGCAPLTAGVCAASRWRCSREPRGGTLPHPGVTTAPHTPHPRAAGALLPGVLRSLLQILQGSAKRNPSESEHCRRVYPPRYWGSPGGLYVIFCALRQLSSTAVNL